jgi:hypothetical protein
MNSVIYAIRFPLAPPSQQYFPAPVKYLTHEAKAPIKVALGAAASPLPATHPHARFWQQEAVVGERCFPQRLAADFQESFFCNQR